MMLSVFAQPEAGEAIDESMAMPLRVIDLKRTIENSEAGGIHFTRSSAWHVISHTWSQEVRALSNIIGERQKPCLQGQPASGRVEGYEALFEAAGFGGHPAYQKLIEFLMILEAQEVRWVWFDAVCINQVDKQEKDHEIRLMGTYYQKSLGCYVLLHGIGKGFELLLTGAEDAEDGLNSLLPRWFTRAWTLQEWVLSPWASFIIDLASEQCLCTITSMILDRLKNTCLCCTFDVSLSPYVLHECLVLHADCHASHGNEGCQKAFDLCSIAWSNLACQEVAPHFRKVLGRSHWYFVDDLGFSFLLRLKRYIKQMSDGWDEMDDFPFKMTNQTDCKLMSKIWRKQTTMNCHNCYAVRDLRAVIWGIAERDCLNAEDRVLSVLKLLGVQNAFQVSTGKSLEGQLLRLAKSLGRKGNTPQDQVMLAWLCLVDGFGSTVPNMSWMPHFEIHKGSWQESARLAAPYFYDTCSSLIDFEAVGKCQVSDMGVLQLEGEACIAHLIIHHHGGMGRMGTRSGDGTKLSSPCNYVLTWNGHADRNQLSFIESGDPNEPIHSYYLCDTAEVLTMGDEVSRHVVLEVGGQALMYACAHMATKQCRTCIMISRVPYTRREICIAFGGNSLHCLPPVIPVWLVKMGMCHESQDIHWMVCIGRVEEGPLHKIGYLRTEMCNDDDNPLARLQMIRCSVGGLGKASHELLVNDSYSPIELL